MIFATLEAGTWTKRKLQHTHRTYAVSRLFLSLFCSPIQAFLFLSVKEDLPPPQNPCIRDTLCNRKKKGNPSPCRDPACRLHLGDEIGVDKIVDGRSWFGPTTCTG